MAKIAVYDAFYQSEQYPHSDIAGQALAGLGHEVVGAATDMRLAAQQILDFAGRDAGQRPDVVIMGGRLEREFDYSRDPLTVTEPCTVRRRAWWGGVRERAGRRVTFLMPYFEGHGTNYRFPDVVPVGNVPDDPPRELLEQWSVPRIGIAACVLSRIVETHLPNAVRLGVSGDPMIDAVLSAGEVNRSSPDAVQQLRGRIQQFTSEA